MSSRAQRSFFPGNVSLTGSEGLSLDRESDGDLMKRDELFLGSRFPDKPREQEGWFLWSTTRGKIAMRKGQLTLYFSSYCLRTEIMTSGRLRQRVRASAVERFSPPRTERVVRTH